MIAKFIRTKWSTNISKEKTLAIYEIRHNKCLFFFTGTFIVKFFILIKWFVINVKQNLAKLSHPTHGSQEPATLQKVEEEN